MIGWKQKDEHYILPLYVGALEKIDGPSFTSWLFCDKNTNRLLPKKWSASKDFFTSFDMAKLVFLAFLA